jgi:hypothetical protein
VRCGGAAARRGVDPLHRINSLTALPRFIVPNFTVKQLLDAIP